MCRRLLPNTVAEGERVVLEIEVAGTPEPTVSWFKNNQPLPVVSSLYRLRQQGNCSAIVIEKGKNNGRNESSDLYVTEIICSYYGTCWRVQSRGKKRRRRGGKLCRFESGSAFT